MSHVNKLQFGPMPIISVITVCFNASKYIEQTIKSVLEQKDCDIEYIVIDGGSTDSTLSIIKQYEDKLTTWVSEPDKGIADAMNKGVKLASGDFLVFLHADDYFVDEFALSRAMDHLNIGVDICAFDVIFKTSYKDIKKSTKPFGVRAYFKTPVMHQGVFCKKELFQQLNGFDTSFKIAMDYDFFYRAYQQKVKMKINHYTLSIMRDTGVSSRQDWFSLKQRFAEEKRVHLKNARSKSMKMVYTVYWALYLPYRKVCSVIK